MTQPLPRYISYTHPNNPTRPRIGHLDFETQIITPLSHASGTPFSTLYEVIEVGHAGVIPSTPTVPLSSVSIHAPLPARDVLAIGKNYVEHAKEFNASGYDASDKNDMPSHPVVFTKRATSIVAHGDPILQFPNFTSTLDYEGEIGVIIGKAGHQVKEEDAADYVWGFTIINDVTAREKQRDHKQFFIGKSGDAFCPMGPVAVPKENLPPVLEVQTFVNGESRQRGTTEDLIFSVNRLIATVSEAQTIRPGDVIATGTPAGVGFGLNPPQYLKEGDVVEISVTGLGTLRNAVAVAGADNYVSERVKTVSEVPTSNYERTGGVGLTKLPSGKELYIKEMGPDYGDVIVFVHGLGGTHACFLPLIMSRSLHSQYRCVLFDIEGHGMSPTKADSVITFDSYAEDLWQIIKSLQGSYGNFNIIAHGMGCLIAKTCIWSDPELSIKKLIMINMDPGYDLPEDYIQCLEQRERKAREEGMSSIATEEVVSARTQQSRPLATAAIMQSLLSQNAEGYAKGCRALAQAARSKIEAGTFLGDTFTIEGLDDPNKRAEWTCSLGSEVRGNYIADAGNWLVFESIERLGRLVAEYLDGSNQ